MTRKGPRAGLDEEAVLRVAGKLVDLEGYEALSLARLAQVLGIRTPSLYNHVAGLEGLRRGLAVRGARELRDRLAQAAIGKSSADAILAIAQAYRRFAREHPGLYAASLRAAGPDEPALAEAHISILDVIRAVLAPYGLRDEAEVHAIRGFRSLAHGFVSLELAGGFGMPVDLDESYSALIHMLLLGLQREAGQPSPLDAPEQPGRTDGPS